MGCSAGYWDHPGSGRVTAHRALIDRYELASLDYLPDSSGALFTSSPRVELAWQQASGHNISLHHVARAYHLRAIAFFDESLSA